MSALAHDYKHTLTSNQHHWILWVAPNDEQKSKISNLSEFDKSRSLMLHPKNTELMMQALKTAITSGLYETLVTPKHLLSAIQQQELELLAIRNNTHIAWTQKRLNRASQLSLL